MKKFILSIVVALVASLPIQAQCVNGKCYAPGTFSAPSGVSVTALPATRAAGPVLSHAVRALVVQPVQRLVVQPMANMIHAQPARTLFHHRPIRGLFRGRGCR